MSELHEQPDMLEGLFLLGKKKQTKTTPTYLTKHIYFPAPQSIDGSTANKFLTQNEELLK